MILALTGVPLVIVSIIAFILILGVIIIIHEGGHFLFARRAGILCHEFSIGMGPAIYKRNLEKPHFVFEPFLLVVTSLWQERKSLMN